MYSNVMYVANVAYVVNVNKEASVRTLLAVSAHPALNRLPGSQVLQGLLDGAQAWALAIALVGAFVGAGTWAIASHGHNSHYAARGRMAALTSAGAALVVGAGPGLVNFFSTLGSHIK
jgi:hypothetical protein